MAIRSNWSIPDTAAYCSAVNRSGSFNSGNATTGPSANNPQANSRQASTGGRNNPRPRDSGST